MIYTLFDQKISIDIKKQFPDSKTIKNIFLSTFQKYKIMRVPKNKQISWGFTLPALVSFMNQLYCHSHTMRCNVMDADVDACYKTLFCTAETVMHV